MLIIHDREQDTHQHELELMRRRKEEQEGEEKERFRLEIRAAYLSRGKPEVQRLRLLFESRGFLVATNLNGTEITDVLWPSSEEYEQNYRVFAQAFDLLLATSHQSDSAFHSQPKHRHTRDTAPTTFHKLEEIVLGSTHGGPGMPYFRAMNDPTILVSESHRGTTPAAHSLNVERYLKTGHLESGFYRALVRMHGWTHDFGKLFIADNDVYQDHAQISYYLLRKMYARFIFEKAAEDKKFVAPQDALNLADMFLQPVRWHHILEQWEKGHITEGELLSVLDTVQTTQMTATLAVADRLSVGGKYSVFAFLVFFGYASLLERINVGFKLQSMINSFVEQFLGDVAEVAQTADDLGRLIDKIAVPFIQSLAYPVDGEAIEEALSPTAGDSRADTLVFERS